MKLLPAIVAEPVRAEIVVFCAQETVTAPAPLPPVGEAVSHEPLPAALQLPPWQPLGKALTETLVEPAAAVVSNPVGKIK